MKSCFTLLTILLSFILPAYTASWSKPVTLFESAYKKIILDDLIVENGGVMHILYQDYREAPVFYAKVDANNNVLFRHNLQIAGSTQMRGASLQRDSTTGKLFVQINAYIDSLSDQVYTESNDGGVTWSPLRLTPRNANETCRRAGSSMLYIKETGRLFIFYHLICQGVSALTFVTRPNGSSEFSQERIFGCNSSVNHIKPSIRAAYTMSKTQPIIHVVFGEFDAENPTTVRVMHMKSADNGITWTAPQKLDDDYPGFNMLNLFADHDKMEGYFFTSYAKKDSEPSVPLQLIHSTNHGYSFKPKVNATVTPRDFLSWDLRLSSFTFCGKILEPGFFRSFIQPSENIVEYSEWDYKTMTFNVKPHPFDSDLTGAKSGLLMGCSGSEVVLLLGGSVGNNWRIMVSRAKLIGEGSEIQ